MTPTETKSSPERPRWAVCPRPTDDDAVPEWFHLESEARNWQNEVVWPAVIRGDEGKDVPVRFSPKRDASGYEWVRIERIDRKPITRGVGAFRKSQNEVSLIGRDELPPGYRQEIRRDQYSPYLVPICWRQEDSRPPYRGRTFRDFLPLSKVSTSQAADFEAELDDLFKGRFGEFECDLGDDWQFERLSSDAAKREGHMFRGCVIESLPHQLVRIAYDLETSVANTHIQLSSQMVAMFWTSWRVWNHLVVWCRKIRREMISQNRAAVLLNETIAVRFVCQQAWTFAHEVKTSGNLSEGTAKQGAGIDRPEGFKLRNAPEVKREPGAKRRKRRSDPTVQRIKNEVRQLRGQGLDYKSICDRLGDKDRTAAKAEKQNAEDKISEPQFSPATAAKQSRAVTVAKLIKELNNLKPQMFEDESEYNRLWAQYPDFLVFKIAEHRSDLRMKILAIRGSARHIRLAQELAAAHYGRQFATICDDWKDHKPAEFRRPK